ncbi:MAG: hypothetical protein IKJ27_04705 [Clostridia bacterium]|nr:hypothetical protein [Clostridia bacterium]
MIKKINDFCGFLGEDEYVIGGVLYKVSSTFAPANICNLENTIGDKVQKYVGSDFAHLTLVPDVDKIEAEYVTTAGKED